jgi:hypothetical protein
MHGLDKRTTPQETKSFKNKNKNNNNFKDEMFKNKLNRTILMSVSGVRLQCSW